FETIAGGLAVHPRGDECLWGSSMASLRLRRNAEPDARPLFRATPGGIAGVSMEQEVFQPIDDASLCEIMADSLALDGKALRLKAGGRARVMFNPGDLAEFQHGFSAYALVRFEGGFSEACLEHRGFHGDHQAVSKRTPRESVPGNGYQW